jgi:DNA polymerase I-like protein with 3'-5' exonuclease and polymerase domains
MRLVFDIEANGLYWDASVIHCLVAIDKDTKTVYKFEPSKVEQGLKFLMTADELIGHNVIGYDIPVIQKIHPWFCPPTKVTDTLVLSRLIYSDLSDRDQAARVQMEGKLIGSHSLKAWGYRLKLLKDDYQGGFEAFSEDMLAYNVRDVEVTDRLHDLLAKHEAYSEMASELEHQVATIVAKQERYGFLFDKESAERLTAHLMIRREELAQNLRDTFKPWEELDKEFIPKRDNKTLGYVKGVPVQKMKTIVFNPGSRHHIANRLKALRGWIPKEYTPDGSAKVDEAVLSKLQYPEAKLMCEYLMVQKRLGMLAEGQNAYLKLVKDNSRIHGEVNTNGAVTGRATHRNPNTAQCPAVGAPYGKEFRSLFLAPQNRKLIGIDVSGLELRMLASYMHPFDGGVYGKEVIDGDIHTLNMQAAGLPDRNTAKRWIYAFLYGAGPEKLGEVAGKDAKYGRELKNRFLKKVPALAQLIDAVQEAVAERGFLVGLDGRRIAIRSSHAALNSLLQGGGSLCCKRFLVEVDMAIERLGWRDKVQQVAWVHDEIQCEVDPDIADDFGKLAVDCVVKSGEFFKLNVPLTGEYKIGQTWADTH